MNDELVFEKRRQIGAQNRFCWSLKLFYTRTSSYGSLTVNLIASNSNHSADLIPSGGGDGLFNISWGANAHFAQKAQHILETYGFKLIDRWWKIKC